MIQINGGQVSYNHPNVLSRGNDYLHHTGTPNYWTLLLNDSRQYNHNIIFSYEK